MHLVRHMRRAPYSLFQAFRSWGQYCTPLSEGLEQAKRSMDHLVLQYRIMMQLLPNLTFSLHQLNLPY